MAKKRIIVIAIAIILSTVVFILFKKVLGSEAEVQSVQRQPVIVNKIETTWVLSLARDLEAGENISERDVQWIEWPKEKLPSKTINIQDKNSEMAKKLALPFIGKSSVTPIQRGLPINRQMFLEKKDNGTFLSAKLSEGKRAISVAISEISAAGGFILPGDYVDIVAVVQEKQSQPIIELNAEDDLIIEGGIEQSYDVANSRKSKVILKNALVLAIGSNTQASRGGNQASQRNPNSGGYGQLVGNQSNANARTATLQVTLEQAKEVVQAQSEGASLSLLLVAKVEAGEIAAAQNDELQKFTKFIKDLIDDDDQNEIVQKKSSKSYITVIRNGKSYKEKIIKK